jgi:hypothetical protein
MVVSLHASDSEPMARWTSQTLLKIIIFIKVALKLPNYVTLRVDVTENAM